MAVTIATTPATQHAVFNPVEFVCTSDRYDTAANVEAISAFADYSGTVAGTVKCTTSTINNFVTGDIIVITGTTNYNGTFEVTVIDNDEFYFTDTWVADDATGTATRTNNNFKMKAEVIVSAVTIATTYAYPLAANFNFDIAQALQSQVTSRILALGTNPVAKQTVSNTDESAVAYTVKFTEIYDDEDGQAKDGDNNTSSTLYGYNIAIQSDESLSDYIITTGGYKNCLTKKTDHYLKAGEEFQLSFITNESTLPSTIIAYQYSGGGINRATLTASGTMDRGVIVVNDTTFASLTTYLDIWVEDSGLDRRSVKYRFYRDSKSNEFPKRLEWKNKLGGFDAYTFYDSEISVKPKKTTVLSDDTEQVSGLISNQYETLISKPESNAVMTWLKDLYESTKVYLVNDDLDDREEVILINDSEVLQSRKTLAPMVKIKRQQSKIN
jgi:hypothetical protein